MIDICLTNVFFIRDDQLPEFWVCENQEPPVKEKKIMTKSNSNKTSNKAMLSQKVKINRQPTKVLRRMKKSITHSLLCMCQRKR